MANLQAKELSAVVARVGSKGSKVNQKDSFTKIKGLKAQVCRTWNSLYQVHTISYPFTIHARQQFQIRHYMGVSAFLIEIGFNKLGLFYRLDKSEEVCMLEKRLCDVD